jgi:TPR repeat protein
MIANDSAPPIRLDRYIALLAVLLAFVLGLLIISEQQRAADPNRVEGTVPPVETLLDHFERERLALLAEQARVAEALAPTERALRSVESEVGELAKEAELFRDMLGDEAAQSLELAQRIAVVEADRNRLLAKVEDLTTSQQTLASRLAEIEAKIASPSAGDQSGQQSAATASNDQQATSEVPAPPDSGSEALQSGRMVTFDQGATTTADGVEAYRAGDYALAERIWRSLALQGDARAQFYVGSLLFEGRTAPPDLVMAYVWLKRSVDSGYLPAIEMRRRVRAMMSEEEYERALAVQSNS